jgi:hypothetical protein
MRRAPLIDACLVLLGQHFLGVDLDLGHDEGQAAPRTDRGKIHGSNQGTLPSNGERTFAGSSSKR